MARKESSTAELQLWQTAPQVQFSPKMAASTDAQSLLVAARQGAGFEVASGQLGHAIESRATHLLMDFSQTACAIRYQIDGEWESTDPLDRETGDVMLYAIKQLAQMNPADRRSTQKGTVGLKLVKDKYDLIVQSQGVKTGERVLAQLVPEKLPFSRLAELGMRDKMIENFKSGLNSTGSLVIVSAPKGQGLSTTWNVALNEADKFIRDFQSFEDKGNPEPDVINVAPNFFGGDTGLTCGELVAKMILKEPDVLIFPELPPEDAFKAALDQCKISDKQVIVQLTAANAVEALVRVIAKYPSCAAEIASVIKGVTSQKLIRRLCENCKVGFEPPPKLLQQLGIPAGRVALLYQPFIPPPIEQQVDEKGRPALIEPCHVCNGRGYFSRVAVFEYLQPGDQLRDAVTKTQDMGKLMQVAKVEGFKNLQAEAVLTVARGLTGLDELKRAFAPKKK